MAETKKAKPTTKLTEIAKAKLAGKVCITDAKGVTHEFIDETAAFEAWKDRIGSLGFRRGGFFEKAAVLPADESAPKFKKAKH